MALRLRRRRRPRANRRARLGASRVARRAARAAPQRADNRSARSDGALEREARIEPSGAVQVPEAEPATLPRPHPAAVGASAEPEQDTSELLRMPL